MRYLRNTRRARKREVVRTQLDMHVVEGKRVRVEEKRVRVEEKRVRVEEKRVRVEEKRVRVEARPRFLEVHQYCFQQAAGETGEARVVSLLLPLSLPLS